MHALEEKGQAWLASRHSATSLSSPREEEGYDALAYSPERKGGDGMVVRGSFGYHAPRSVPPSRFASRVGSRVGSRRGSRVDLGGVGKRRVSSGVDVGAAAAVAGGAVEGIEPDFVDLGDEDEDPREEGARDTVDEGEMRRLVLGRVGGWVDWMVGWMDLRGEVIEDDEDERDEEQEEGEEGANEPGHEVRGIERSKGAVGDMGKEEVIGVPAPGEGGVWDDARWLMKIAAGSL